MEAVKRDALKLAGREFDTNQLKSLCAFLFRSERSAGERRYLHWELEFPEVFFNEDGTPRERPGFDAVIGNPPYGTISDKLHLPYVKQTYASFEGNLENYGLFMDQSLALCRTSARTGFIVPVTWCQIRMALR
jgi:hypothetical protein